jgi:hypothetical protein
LYSTEMAVSGIDSGHRALTERSPRTEAAGLTYMYE